MSILNYFTTSFKHCKTAYLGIIFSIIVIHLSQIAYTQPYGWRDATRYYYYTILDKNESPISFKTDTTYSIEIDSLHFSSPNIPSDSLVRVTVATNDFYNYIRINDLSFKTPIVKSKYLDIKIIHGKDTMHISQFRDLTLQFQPGYFYFPSWAGSFLKEDLFKASGMISIANKDQSLFKVPESNFNKYLYDDGNHKWKERVEDEVIKNFDNSSIQMRSLEKEILIKNPLLSYKDRYPWWESKISYKYPWWAPKMYSTPDSNKFVGLVSYRLDTNGVHAYKTAFSVFNKKKNTISHWMPKKNFNLIGESSLFFDEYNKIFYLLSEIRGYVKNPYEQVSLYQYPFKYAVYQSVDYGNSWNLPPVLQDLSNQIDKLEFLDKDYSVSLGLKRREATADQSYKTTHGIYYLMKNFQIIDSLELPRYNIKYYDYIFFRVNDSTINLGPWSFTFNPDAIYFQPQLVKRSDKWVFTVASDSMIANLRKTYDSLCTQIAKKEEYFNFELIDERTLQFKRDIGSLSLHEGIKKIVEKGKSIYLIQDKFLLLSFDAGRTWYFYPKSLDPDRNYSFLSATDNGELSFFDLRKMKKLYFKFDKK